MKVTRSREFLFLFTVKSKRKKYPRPLSRWGGGVVTSGVSPLQDSSPSKSTTAECAWKLTSFHLLGRESAGSWTVSPAICLRGFSWLLLSANISLPLTRSELACLTRDGSRLKSEVTGSFGSEMRPWFSSWGNSLFTSDFQSAARMSHFVSLNSYSQREFLGRGSSFCTSWTWRMGIPSWRVSWRVRCLPSWRVPWRVRLSSFLKSLLKSEVVFLLEESLEEWDVFLLEGSLEEWGVYSF